ncbi:protein kinase domain-containing protein [Prescottella subtropica]|uniref:protein kinase domain-containing protein n=1 Tax=Prescottella subtropica TaxID=2545757 RepID=UPI0010F5D530|nr:protein kinase [Prescottella subtropica]
MVESDPLLTQAQPSPQDDALRTRLGQGTQADLLRTQAGPVPQAAPETDGVLASELAAAGFTDAEEIGRGGFGTVFRCTETELDRTVAVKVLTTALDEQNRARFEREQRAMGQLTGHPNVVGVLRVGETAAGHPFLVMPYHRLGNLEQRIRDGGPLPAIEVLQVGAKLSEALQTVHEHGIVHRDVKPANILFTDYGEPALADFGIAHVSGGFQTAAGTITGSPAFTAPEVLEGDAPSSASDIYGLGATLFCALTGHAAFERRSGEQVVAQFLRITTAPVPDLRDGGIPDDVSTVVERAMARDPAERPSATDLAELLGQLYDDVSSGAVSTRTALQPRADLPADVTSFVGRQRELATIRHALDTARLVTLTGIGGVGKTRLAFRAAAAVRRSFPDGVWLVELAGVHDPALVVDAVATALGVRNFAGRPLRAALVDALTERTGLLVLDNCEQVIGAVAELVEGLLGHCPDLRVLATSRELLGLGGETVVPVAPLHTPDPERPQSTTGMSRADAVQLFAERAAAAAPGFTLTDDNTAAVAAICTRLDGLPLAIELAAARTRALSVEQILQQLTERHTLPTWGNRGVPERQQTLRLSIDWSYDLCTPVEQRLWNRLSLFVGGFDLDDAEQVCSRVGEDPSVPDLLDVLASLVDKSIVVCDDADGRVYYRILETVREYGIENLERSDWYQEVRNRFRTWYLRMARDAEADWISPRQLEWSARLFRELPNLREAFEFALADTEGDAVPFAAAMYPFWMARGRFTGGRHALDRALAQNYPQPPFLQAKALFAAAILAAFQGDLAAASARVAQAAALDTADADPFTRAYVAIADGVTAFCSGDFTRARQRLADAADTPGIDAHPQLHLEALSLLGWAHVGDNTTRALTYQGRALALAQASGEYVHRGYALWANGVDMWRSGNVEHAVELLEAGLRLTRETDDPLMVFTCLQALAWITAERGQLRRAVVLMGAATAHRRLVGSHPVLFPNLLAHQQEFEETVRAGLDEDVLATACHEGAAMSTEAALAYALGERDQEPDGTALETTPLTKRERQVADLVAEGLTNKEIATRLTISQRTVDGHVDHILSKLGFTSRVQVATWIAESVRAG